MSLVSLVTIVVDEYAPAVEFFVGALGFELVEDSPALTNDGRTKRWVVVRPPGAETGILLARADGDGQEAIVGKQVAGRVGFVLHVEDFEATYANDRRRRRVPDASARGAVRPGRGVHRRRRQPMGPARAPVMPGAPYASAGADQTSNVACLTHW